MDVKVCKNCRRLFKYMYGPDLCPDCAKLVNEEKQQKNRNVLDTTDTQNALHNKGFNNSVKSLVKDEEEKFEQVRDYIMANPRASVAQIAEVNDIPPTKLFEWIKDDRLEFSEDSQYAWFNCMKCGAKIRSGRLCNRCKVK